LNSSLSHDCEPSFTRFHDEKGQKVTPRARVVRDHLLFTKAEKLAESDQRGKINSAFYFYGQKESIA
jgi:hypothetical protein